MTRWLTRKRRTFEMSRRVVGVDGGLVRIEQRFSGTEEGVVLATAGSWFASLVEVHRGELSFRTGLDVRNAGRRFLLYCPPRSIIRMPAGAAAVTTDGVGSLRLPEGLPREPLALPLSDGDWSPTMERVAALLARRGAVRIDADQGCDPRVIAARQLLVDKAFSPLPVGGVARQLGWHSSVLSRRFSQAYGITPRNYCQRLRIHTSVMRLFTGVAITRVAFDVGFGDLSQFYRQFRRVTGETPGRYREAGSG